LAGDSGVADARADLRRDFCGVEQWYPKRLGNGRNLPDAKSPRATSPFQIAARAMVGTMIGGGSQELPSSSLGIIALNKVLQILDLAHARMFAPECSLAVTCPVASKRPVRTLSVDAGAIGAGALGVLGLKVRAAGFGLGSFNAQS
jgi:hypothetical protein